MEVLEYNNNIEELIEEACATSLKQESVENAKQKITDSINKIVGENVVDYNDSSIEISTPAFLSEIQSIPNWREDMIFQRDYTNSNSGTVTINNKCYKVQRHTWEFLNIMRSSTCIIEDNSDIRARFSGADWFDKIRDIAITIAGLGGIGSYTALYLSRLNPKHMYLWDFDKVESINMSGQLYSTSHIGLYKTVAMRDTINDYSYYNKITTFTGAIEGTSEVQPITISGFDNMKARKAIYKAWKTKVNNTHKNERHTLLLIDGRLAAEEFQIFCIQGDDTRNMDIYEKQWLFDDSEAEPTTCSYKQTTYCAAMIGAYISNLVVNFVTNMCEPLVLRDLPFLTTYDATTMYLKTTT